MPDGTTQPAKPEPRFRLLTIEELEQLPDPSWLIDGFLPEGSLAELYGPPGVGKSFLALDWALSVSAGVSWLGREVERGDVVFISAEGARGLTKRIAAWRVKHPGASLDSFRVVHMPVDMLAKDDPRDLIKAIQSASCDPALVVIDTLARCFGSGDENAAQDMNKFIGGTDRIKGAFKDTTVLVIHHSGKDTSKGDRGSTALRAAADTVMELRKAGNKGMKLACEKQKDWDEFEGIGLTLRPVPIDDGEKSCVVEERDSEDSPRQPAGNENDHRALKALRKIGAEGATYTDWRKASGIKKSTFTIVIGRLKKCGRVRHDGTIYRVVNDAEGQGQG